MDEQIDRLMASMDRAVAASDELLRESRKTRRLTTLGPVFFLLTADVILVAFVIAAKL